MIKFKPILELLIHTKTVTNILAFGRPLEYGNGNLGPVFLPGGQEPGRLQSLRLQELDMGE